jgi:hypothetical protein
MQEDSIPMPLTFAELLVEPVRRLLSTCADSEQLLALNHPDLLWGRILVTMYEDLLPLLSPDERHRGSSLFRSNGGPDYFGIVALLSAYSEYYPFLLFRLARRLHDWVDCPASKTKELEMFLYETAAFLLMDRGRFQEVKDGHSLR